MPLLIGLCTDTQKYFAIFDHNLTDNSPAIPAVVLFYYKFDFYSPKKTKVRQI
jgi:hypothetical protein